MHIRAADLIGALRAEGLRITRARAAICEVLAAAHAEHLSAADILARVRDASDANFNESTVYRTLDVLQQLGYLRHVHLGHGPGVYHFVDEAPHHHLVCEQCGTSIDVPLADVQPLLSRLAARHGFVTEDLHFALSGRCRRCGAAG